MGTPSAVHGLGFALGYNGEKDSERLAPASSGGTATVTDADAMSRPRRYLRRTCLTWITRVGFGRDAMDRVANHRTSKVTDVYDRHGYAEEDRRIMSAVARLVLSLLKSSQGDGQRGLRGPPPGRG